MIKHLQLLEMYLSDQYDVEKARVEMKHIYVRFLIIAEITLMLSVTPVAFIASAGTLMWLVLASIHLVPRWRECGFKVRSYFLPLLPMFLVTGVTLPIWGGAIGKMWENYFITGKRPVMMLFPFVMLLVTYGLHNQEEYNTPKITIGKYVCGGITGAYFLLFAVDNPVRDMIIRKLL